MAKRKSKSPIGGLLGKLLSFLKGGKGGAKPRSLPTTLIFGGIMAIVTALFSIKLTLARRKAAKLQHKVNVAEEEKIQAVATKKLTKQVEVRKALTEAIQGGRRRIAELKEETKTAKRAAKVMAEQIRAAESWDDIKVR